MHVMLSIHRLTIHLKALLMGIYSSLDQECMQRGAGSVVGKFTGAPLVLLESGAKLSARHINEAVSCSDESIVIKDPATALLMAGPAVGIQLSNGSVKQVPGNHIIHPKTAHAIPMEGNVCYDPLSKQMVVTVDAAGDTPAVALREEQLIPYVPYPLSYNTGEPVYTGLQQPERLTDLKFGGPMRDPGTGLTVPICAVTIHPQTHSILAVGATYSDLITNLPVPLEIGGMMLDAATQSAVPIMGVYIHPGSGEIMPIGGFEAKSKSAILLGQPFNESLSQLAVRSTSAYVDVEKGELVQGYGGHGTLLEADELLHEKAVVDSLQCLRDLVITVLQSGEEEEFDRSKFDKEITKFDATYQELMASRARNYTFCLRTVLSIRTQMVICDGLASTGGSPGYMEFKATGQPLPLLLGVYIPDPSKTELQVRVCCCAREW